MRSSQHTPTTASRKAGQPFAINAKASDPFAHIKMASVFALALLTVLIAGLISMNASNASQAQETGALTVQGMMATKTDRKVSAAGETCQNQAWGAWSEKCAAELTGATKVRNVSFVTVEKQPDAVNQTILARYPAN